MEQTAKVMDLGKCGGVCRGACRHYSIGEECPPEATYEPREVQLPPLSVTEIKQYLASTEGQRGVGDRNMMEWLVAEVERLQERVDYCTNMGLTFGIMKTSDRPEGFLAHTWSQDSDHERMFREWTESIGKIDRQAVLKAVADEPEYPGEIPAALRTILGQALEQKDLDLLVHAMRQTVQLTKTSIAERIRSMRD